MKYILIILTILFGVKANAQIAKTIKPKPSRVIVYLTGAELTYQESIGLQTGTNELIIEGVSPNVDENSISAFVKGALVIDTKKGMRYPDAPKIINFEKKYTDAINRINDSLQDLVYVLKDCNNKRGALQRERTLLLNNRLMRGEFAKDSLGLLKSTLDLLRSRLNNIDEEELIVEKKEDKMKQLNSVLEDRKQYFINLQSNTSDGLQLDHYNPIYQIIVTVESIAATTGALTLKYYVSTAGWMPRYDILATSNKESIQLVHRAQVYQSTGVDWKDVHLVLSTSNPNMGNTKPLLNPWNLYFGYPNTYSEDVNKKKIQTNAYNYNQYAPQMKTLSVESDMKDEVNGNIAGAVEPIFTMGDNFLRTEFEIKSKYSIVSDNKAHNVVVSSTDVPVTLTYMTVPKLDRDAFLMGKIANWEDLNLLPASARIYFDESYIGLTAIDPETTKDTLYMNLGRDRSIVVKRIALKEKCKEQVLSDFKVVTKTYEISIRNTKAMSLDFEIEDQIPITSDNNIKVTLLDKDGALYNELTGKLTWKVKVKSKETKKVVFSYEVKYPKDKFIMGL